MSFGGIEVRINRHYVTCLYDGGVEYIRGSAPLVGGEEVLEPEDLLDGFSHFVVRGRTCVALVSQHHGAPLFVAHGAGAGVG